MVVTPFEQDANSTTQLPFLTYEGLSRDSDNSDMAEVGIYINSDNSIGVYEVQLPLSSHCLLIPRVPLLTCSDEPDTESMVPRKEHQFTTGP